MNYPQPHRPAAWPAFVLRLNGAHVVDERGNRVLGWIRLVIVRRHMHRGVRVDAEEVRRLVNHLYLVGREFREARLGKSLLTRKLADAVNHDSWVVAMLAEDRVSKPANIELQRTLTRLSIGLGMRQRHRIARIDCYTHNTCYKTENLLQLCKMQIIRDKSVMKISDSFTRGRHGLFRISRRSQLVQRARHMCGF
jgi:hypothetical protein